MTAGRTASCTAGYGAADWRALAAHRADPRSEEPEGWAAALDHLDRCANCRRAALAADPTLVFRRLRAAPAAVPAGAAADPEAAAMRQAVAALREASRLGATAGAGRELRATRSGWTRALPRAAAAAGLAAAALAAGSAGPAGMTPTAPARATMAPVAQVAAAAPALLSAAVPAAWVGTPAVPAQMTQMPLLEELDRPNARVYQIEDVHLSVVWIVDKNLDV